MKTLKIVGFAFAWTSLALVLGGCSAAAELGQSAAGSTPDESAQPDGTNEAVATTSSALRDWATTNTNGPPASCDAGTLAANAWCGGNHCARVAIDCQPAPNPRTGTTRWSPYFSEEVNNYYFICPDDQFVTGVSCLGTDCDNVSLQCTSFPDTHKTDCHWTGRFSEEQGTQKFGVGYGAAGAACYGNNCDDMSYYICDMS